MNALTVFRALGPIDARNVRRDSLLRWILILPLILALVSRRLLPSLLTQIESWLDFPLLPYFPPLMSYVLVTLVPFLVGFVTGFLLLDQRDDRTLIALQITPLSLNGYLAYRLAMPMGISLLVTLLVVPLSGLVQIGVGPLLLAALVAAPQAPLFALALAAIAQNKVQGFALMKASSVIMLPPMVAYFVNAPWQWLLGIAPTYWPARLFWALVEGNSFWLYLLVGLPYQLLLLWWLVRRFNHIMTR